MTCSPISCWLYGRFLPLTLLTFLIILPVGRQASAGASIQIDSSPSQASIFGEQRGSMFFYGYTPLRMSREDMSGDRLVIAKTGYKSQRLAVGNQSEVRVELTKDSNIEIVPDSLRSHCPTDNLKAYARMVESFRQVSTKLQIDTPFASLTAEGKNSLLIVTRVVDKKTRSELRSVRRSEGIKAFENRLEDQVKPVIGAVISDIKEIPCVDYLALRVIYSDSKLKLDIKRIQVPWQQSYVYQQGSDIVYETKYGTRGENVSTIKVSDGDDRFVDYFYLIQSKIK